MEKFFGKLKNYDFLISCLLQSVQDTKHKDKKKQPLQCKFDI